MGVSHFKMLEIPYFKFPMKMTLISHRPKSWLALSGAVGLFLAAQTVSHAQYYVRGQFNDWGTSAEMAHLGDGVYSYHMTGLNPGQIYQFKIATTDWNPAWPSENARAQANANGEITFRAFDHQTWEDGSLPNDMRRVGFSHSGLHDWELVGSMNDWSGGTAWILADQGDSVFRTEVFLNPGDYHYKFRMAGSWDMSIGQHFGDPSGDLLINVPVGATYVFELDLLNGSHSVIPEPSTYAAIFGALALLGAFAYRRRANGKK